MSAFCRQFGFLITASLLLAGGLSVAGETAVEPTGKGVDLLVANWGLPGGGGPPPLFLSPDGMAHPGRL